MSDLIHSYTSYFKKPDSFLHFLKFAKNHSKKQGGGFDAYELQQFNIDKINAFYQKISGNDIQKLEHEQINLKVLGIPVILYMAIMSNVQIRKNTTTPELYNRIFSETEGIFSKFTSGRIGYDQGEQILRDPINTKKYLNFLCKIAFDMFSNDSLEVQKRNYKFPQLKFQGNKVGILEFPMSYLFDNTKDTIEFMHKSIYEYFVSEYIFKTIYDVIDKNNKKCAEALAKLFLKGILSREICYFLKYRIRKSDLVHRVDTINKVYQLMIQDGMTYYTGICYPNVIAHEANIFVNLLQLMHVWHVRPFEITFNLADCIQYKNDMEWNLKGVDLWGKYLKGLDLKGINFEGALLGDADLTGSDLRGANLEKAFLQNTKLENADLRNANLKDAKLHGADLRSADLRNADLTNACLTKADLRDADLRCAKLENVGSLAFA